MFIPPIKLKEMKKVVKQIKELWLMKPGSSDLNVLKIGDMAWNEKILEIKLVGEGTPTALFEVHVEGGKIRAFPWNLLFNIIY